jgi:hypothetical protein
MIKKFIMKEIGLMEIDVVKENKLINLRRNIGENGNIIKNMDLEDLNFKMEIYMKGISKEEVKMDLENSILIMVINIKVVSKRINSMEEVSISGKMVQCMKDNSLMV